MKDKTFFSGASDLRQKLNNTVIRYNGIPYYCSCDGQHEHLDLAPIDGTSKEPFRVDPDDKKLDISSPPLGFVNYDNSCFYVGRQPHRRSVQGLTDGNMTMHDLNGVEVGLKSHFFAGKRLFEVIQGVYPTFAAAFKRANNVAQDKEYSQAFSRQFALRKPANGNIFLYHRFMPIGEYDRLNSFFTLIPTYNNSVVINNLKSHGVPVHESEY